MGGLEVVIFALVVLFYIISWIYRTIRGLMAAARKAFGAGAVAPVADVRQPAWEQTRRQTPSQQVETRLPRRPEAGGPAVTAVADSVQFGAQIARIEAEESPGLPPPEAARDESRPKAGAVFGSRDDLIRAVILQQILTRPLSQRGRVPRHKEQPPASPQ